MSSTLMQSRLAIKIGRSDCIEEINPLSGYLIISDNTKISSIYMVTAHAVNATVKYFAYLKNLNRIIGYANKAVATITKRTVASFIVMLI